MSTNVDSHLPAPIMGRVLIYDTREKNSATAISMNQSVRNELGPILQSISGHYSPIPRTSFY